MTPAKINLGLANYGRGYLLADPKCAKYDCVWTGPSKAGECTELAGVFSQCEINRIIASKNLKPEIIAGGAGVKQIIFDGQWVGYDDNETLGMKQELAVSPGKNSPKRNYPFGDGLGGHFGPVRPVFTDGTGTGPRCPAP